MTNVKVGDNKITLKTISVTSSIPFAASSLLISFCKSRSVDAALTVQVQMYSKVIVYTNLFWKVLLVNNMAKCSIAYAEQPMKIFCLVDDGSLKYLTKNANQKRKAMMHLIKNIYMISSQRNSQKSFRLFSSFGYNVTMLYLLSEVQYFILI